MSIEDLENSCGEIVAYYEEESKSQDFSSLKNHYTLIGVPELYNHFMDFKEANNDQRLLERANFIHEMCNLKITSVLTGNR